MRLHKLIDLKRWFSVVQFESLVIKTKKLNCYIFQNLQRRTIMVEYDLRKCNNHYAPQWQCALPTVTSS